MTKEKIIVTQHFSMLSLNDSVEYNVEAKKGRSRWRIVGGPFPDRESANRFARKYSAEHPYEDVRVVVYQ